MTENLPQSENQKELYLRKLGMAFLIVSIIIMGINTYIYYKDVTLVKFKSCNMCTINTGLVCSQTNSESEKQSAFLRLNLNDTELLNSLEFVK